MKKTLFNVGFALLISAFTFTACSKKAENETKEATEAVAGDVKEGAAEAKDAVSDAATDVKEGAQDVASDVKDAGKDAVSDVKAAINKTTDAVDSKLSKLSASARTEYDSFNKEINRLDEEIKKASALEKVKLEKTKATFIAKRDALLK
ncbi:hypothetical protein [Dyadobacter sp. CY312]|uniref:hypothetical protein n=1 Tax=Dyadobacter sp. CY312 TaxID=2907303 RepID=UPI001F2151E2|nr:hypothetical protein [Dyadobacter sp. CY312]MCE7042001.1 hypothetical protein [Dyadobacter sp. CY312]